MITQNSTADEVINCLQNRMIYNSTTGLFLRLKDYGKHKAGSIIHSECTNGYLRLRAGNRVLMAHRIAFAWMTGRWPEYELDHIDGNRQNNAFNNLRECNHVENMQNLTTSPNNTSGYVGVSFYKRLNKWRADISLNYKKQTLGYYGTKEEAANAYIVAKEQQHVFNPKVRI